MSRTTAPTRPLDTPWRVLLLTGFLAAAGCTSGTGGGGEQTTPGPDDGASTFSKSYGGPLHDEANLVLNTSDGGFLLLGTAESVEPLAPGAAVKGGDWWLQKLDANGNVEVNENHLFGGGTLSNGADWRRALPLADGGVILTGALPLTQDITRADGSRELITVGHDFAVARLSPMGAVMWSVSRDSGAWQNYDYFAAGHESAAASDFGLDVWPAADGGYVVAGISTGNLEDRLAIGFPCEDDDIDSLAAQDCSDRPANAGNRFAHAFSIVVMRLNDDGSLRWTRRLTDNAFDNGNFAESGARDVRANEPAPDTTGPAGVIVRASADGGVVLARSIAGGIVVHRLAPDGSTRWRAVLGGILSPTAIVENDEGFAIVGDDHVIQLDANGGTRWVHNLKEYPTQRIVLNDATQFCESGTPRHCFIVAVGSFDVVGSDVGRQIGVAWIFDDHGGLAQFADAVIDASDLQSLTRIAPGVGNTFELTGVSASQQLARMQLHLSFPFTGDPPVFTNYRVGTGQAAAPDGPRSPLPELRADGGVLQLSAHALTLRSFDPRCVELPEVALGVSAGAEVLQAAAQIGEGRYVLAGTRREGGVPHVVVMRYDLGTSGVHVAWQRMVATPADAEGEIAEVHAAAATGDGGVVLSLGVISFEQTRGLLIKLDADGNPLWQARLPAPARELEPASGGDITALSSHDETRVMRLSAGGEILWEKRVSIAESAAHLTTMTPTAEGDMVLAGTAGTTLSLLRLTADGTAISAREVQLAALAPTAKLFDPRIRETSNGDFVLAMSESALLTTAPAGAERPLPYGQDNVFILKIDVSGHALWGRVYGGASAEGVHAMSLRNDGTIAVAGYSDSLGDGREAWLLKLSADGYVSDGCNALLGSLPVASLASIAERSGLVETVAGAAVSARTASLIEANLPMHDPRDFVTARQCLGSAGGVVTPGGETRRLTVAQIDGRHGVVTSEPRGISCGTGLDICAADFARGSRITLRADEDRFVAWRSDCEEGSGGTQLTCVVTLNDDLTVQADFRPPAPAGHFTLSFEIQGPGSVLAGDINCREDTQPLNCAQEFTDGASVSIRAFPEQDWVGSGYDALFLGWSGDEECVSLGAERTGFVTVDHDVHCIARFRGPNIHLLRIFGSVGGEVTNNPPGGPGQGGFHCREIFTGTCQARYASTTTVPLLATPDFGYRFVGWGGECASFGSAPAIQVVVADNMDCTASFAPGTTPQMLTVLFNNGAPDRIAVSDLPGINCFDGPDSDCTEEYLPGTVVTLHSDYPGVIWEGCDRTSEGPGGGRRYCEVRMDLIPRIVIAVFPPR